MDHESDSFGTVTPAVAVKSIWETFDKGNRIPQTRIQSSLYRALFCDLAQHFPNFASLDFSYLLSRIEREGMSFCLDTLPLLGRAFEVSLITLEPLKVPDGWKLQRGARLPKFLGELFSQLFRPTGEPLYTILHKEKYNDLAVHACRFIRQVCMMWSKSSLTGTLSETGAVLPCRKTEKALRGFIQRCSRTVVIRNDDPQNKSYLNEARRLIGVVLRDDGTPDYLALRDFERNPWGRHGPGAVAGRECGKEKWNFHIWPGLPSNLFDWFTGKCGSSRGIVTLSQQPDARVCAVPKDFRGPRVICIEPKENQFAQQGLMDLLYRRISSHPLTRSTIDFLDTKESQQLCYNSQFATIDLKDASDMVSLQLGRLLLPRWFFSLVTRYRSRHVLVRNDDCKINMRVKTTCLATMGNATCFPLETMIFWALALGVMITVRDSFPKSKWGLLPLKLRVFGDDIIVPLWAADAVCCALESCGLSVNTSKTCTFTPVRESCGEWVFMGKPVRIFRFRTTEIASHSDWLHWRDHLQDLMQTEMPALQSEAGDMVSEFFHPKKFRWNKHLQRIECLAPQFIQLGRRTELLDYAGLYAWHVRNDRIPFLKGTRKSVKMRWQDPYVVMT